LIQVSWYGLFDSKGKQLKKARVKKNCLLKYEKYFKSCIADVKKYWVRSKLRKHSYSLCNQNVIAKKGGDSGKMPR
jgi:hypothetical protein